MGVSQWLIPWLSNIQEQDTMVLHTSKETLQGYYVYTRVELSNDRGRIMRCLSCNHTLDNEENALVFEHGEHIDLCKACLDTTDIQPYLGNLEQLVNEREHYEDH